MILLGDQIKKNVENGNIIVTPFNVTNINSASLDLTLDSKLLVYKKFPLDAKKANEYDEINIPESGFIMQPNIGYLGCTVEKVSTSKFVPIVDGKSSIGRLFLFVHVTAGYGEPNFNGQYTLEFVAVHPVKIYAGMRICQIRFQEYCGNNDEYDYKKIGNYKENFSDGPVPSLSYKMFKK